MIARKGVGGDVAGGLAGGITSAATNIPVALVACAPIGPAFAGTAIQMMFCGAILSGGLFVALRRTPGLMAGGSMQNALVAAGALAALAADGTLSPGPASGPAFVAVMIVLTTLAALFMAGLWLTGLGRIVPLIPFPVIAGILNSGALLMILAQYQQAAGLDPGHPGVWAHPGAPAVAAVTFALMTWPVRALRILPPIVLALAGGSIAFYGLEAVAPAGFAGHVLGRVPGGLQQLRNAAAGWSAMASLPLAHIVRTLLPPALSIAALSTIDTLMSASAMQDASGRHASAQPDLLALAAGNLAGAVGGAMPVSGGSNATVAAWRAGGRTKLTGVVRTALLLLIVVALPDWMGRVPLAVVAGLVMGSAWRLFDRESVEYARLAIRASPPLRTEMIGNIGIVAVVMLVAVTSGMARAVLAGCVLSLLLFVAGMAQSAVRRRYAGPAGRSRTSRPEWEAEFLLGHGSQIEVVELQGAIFFGSANQVAREIDAALARGARHVILDMRRVTRVDLSGARRMLQVAERFWQAGVDLAFTDIRPGTPVWRYLHDLDLLQKLRPDRVFAGLEEAVERAERQLIAAAPGPKPGGCYTPAAALQAIGLPQDLAAALACRLPKLGFPAGAVLSPAGEASDSFFVLLEGAIDVRLRVPSELDARHDVRLATLMPGLMVGEMGFLNGAPRSADIVARTPVSVLRLEAGVIEAMNQTHPDLKYHLMRAIAGQLGRNLRMSTAALASFEE